MAKFKVGDLVQITTHTFHSGTVKVKRKITYVGAMGIGVRLFGYNPYYLMRIDKVKKVKQQPRRGS